jgi:phosphoribosylformylglycinamidine (FGAM) synthase PurS component
MKAVLTFDLKAETAEEAQKILGEICDELSLKNRISDYRYEIETPEGPVTERCVLADGRVIA